MIMSVFNLFKSSKSGPSYSSVQNLLNVNEHNNHPETKITKTIESINNNNNTDNDVNNTDIVISHQQSIITPNTILYFKETTKLMNDILFSITPDVSFNNLYLTRRVNTIFDLIKAEIVYLNFEQEEGIFYRQLFNNQNKEVYLTYICDDILIQTDLEVYGKICDEKRIWFRTNIV